MKKPMIGRLQAGSGLLFVVAGVVLLALRQPAALALAIGACGLLDLAVAGVMPLQG